MQLCKFMGVTPVEGFEIGKRYEYYSAGIDAIRVLGNGMDKTFTVGGFNRSFTRIPKNNTTETEAKRIDGYCKFISTEPVAELICGGIYEYKIYGPNQYVVYNPAAHERTVWFSATHFSEYFKVMEPSEPITDAIRKVAKEVSEAVDMVNSLPYYKTIKGFDTFDVFEAFNLDKDYYLSTAVNHIIRGGRTDHTLKEDLQKAIIYISRRIATLD